MEKLADISLIDSLDAVYARPAATTVFVDNIRVQCNLEPASFAKLCCQGPRQEKLRELLYKLADDDLIPTQLTAIDRYFDTMFENKSTCDYIGDRLVAHMVNIRLLVEEYLKFKPVKDKSGNLIGFQNPKGNQSFFSLDELPTSY